MTKKGILKFFKKFFLEFFTYINLIPAVILALQLKAKCSMQIRLQNSQISYISKKKLIILACKYRFNKPKRWYLNI